MPKGSSRRSLPPEELAEIAGNNGNGGYVNGMNPYAGMVEDGRVPVADARDIQYLSPGINQTPSKEYLEFLNLPDTIPAELRAQLWSIFTRNLQLTNVTSKAELDQFRATIRSIVKPYTWSGEITLTTMQQIYLASNTMLAKSIGFGERKLLAPWLQEVTKKEIVEEHPKPLPGIIGRTTSFLFGRKG